jgi:hypothetical protein
MPQDQTYNFQEEPRFCPGLDAWESCNYKKHNRRLIDSCIKEKCTGDYDSCEIYQNYLKTLFNTDRDSVPEEDARMADSISWESPVEAIV